MIYTILLNEHFNGCSSKPKSQFVGHDNEEEEKSSCSGFTGQRENFGHCDTSHTSTFVGHDKEEKQSSFSGFTGNRENFGGCSSKPQSGFVGHDDEKEEFSGSEVDIKVFLDKDAENFENHEEKEEGDPSKINIIEDHGSM